MGSRVHSTQHDTSLGTTADMESWIQVHVPVSKPPFDVSLLTEYEESLRSRGLAILKNVFTEEHLDELAEQFDKNWEEVNTRISDKNCEKSPGIYLDSAVPKTYSNQPVWFMEDGSVVLDLAKGRLDFTYGMDKGVFAEPKFFNHPLISALVWRLLKCDWSHYCGALPSFASQSEGCDKTESDYGPWHRDTYSLFGSEEQDQSLPPFYLTLIVPLQGVTGDLGPTEFVLGSHRSTWSEAFQGGKLGLEHVLATSERGDCVLFDGRMIHRGTPCRSSQPRRALYVVFHKKWYSDYVDSQFAARANTHGIPRHPLLPSGFQVPLNIHHPTREDPVWIFSVSVPVTQGEVIWRVGQGDSLVFDCKEMFEEYKEKLSDIEAREAEEKSCKIQGEKIVLRRDLSSLVPEESNKILANVAMDENGNWIATKDISNDSNIILYKKYFE